MRIDLRGPMLACKHAIPRMIESGGGSIINTTSNSALAGDLTLTAYAPAVLCVSLNATVTRAFYAQEGMHTREHLRYNRMLREQGYPAQEIEDRVARLLDRVMGSRGSMSSPPR